MPAATAAEWLTAAAIGTGSFLLIAVAVHFAGHDLPHVSLAPARAAAHRAHDATEQAAQRARLQLAAWLLNLAWRLDHPRGT